jgi:hypothetical protein
LSLAVADLYLRDDLKGAIVNREVEVTPGFAGVKKMRETDLHIAVPSPSNDSVAAPTSPAGDHRERGLLEP